jgi:hypothetical protein
MAPGKGPRPTAATKKIAQISSEIDRNRLRVALAALRSKPEPTTLPAARMPRGSPMSVASTLPHSAT